MGISIGEIIGIIFIVLVFFPIWLYPLATWGSKKLREERDTYRYKLVRVLDGKEVKCRLTYDIARREVEERHLYPECTIKQIGDRVTRKQGLRWLGR